MHGSTGENCVLARQEYYEIVHSFSHANPASLDPLLHIRDAIPGIAR